MSHFECHLNRRFWRSKKVVQIGGRGGGNLDKIQKNSSFSRETFPYGVLYPPGPSVLTATAAMAGGTQLFEGAHLTGGNTNHLRIRLKWASSKQKF